VDRVLLTDRGWPDADIERSLCEAAGYRLVEAPPPADEASLAALAAEADPVGILFCWAPVTGKVLDAAPRLRVATRLGVGLDNIDLDTAARRRITVTRVPDYCVEDVSDHVVALVHAWARGIVGYDRDVHAGRWQPGARTLRRIRDLTIGVWGLGAIGSRTAAKFAALGCRVLCDDRHPERTSYDVTAVPVGRLLADCDVLTLHMPATPDTAGLIDAHALAAMRPGALLVNTSRGSLVDVDALARALEHGRPGAAALDVLPDEPAVPPALAGNPNVILTPHVAFSSDASVTELRVRATEDLLRVLRGEPPLHPVLPPSGPSTG
jgi:D-3-phosphoglycerate dehydrogenase